MSGLSLFCLRITNRCGSITSLSIYSVPVIFLKTRTTIIRLSQSKKPKKVTKRRNEKGIRFYIRELRDIEGVNGAHTELLVVASPIVERGEREVIEDKVAIEREAVEPELIPEAYSGHVSPRRRRRSSLQHLVSRRRRHPPLPISYVFCFTQLPAENSFRRDCGKLAEFDLFLFFIL